MKTAKVVIGAGYGDEGKGITVDHLAQQDCDLVTRFGGGAGAGHTVKHTNVEHIFHHFGSGTLRNVPTYLAEEFVVNPYLFLKERVDLQSKGFNPVVYVDKDCKVTTPLDILINQKIENYRGINKHGSCGVGINETVTRHEWLPITVGSLKFLAKYTRYALRDILYEYVANRLMKLGMDEHAARSIVESVPLKAFQDNFSNHCLQFTKNISIVDKTMLENFDHIVFEGSQGLLLDELHPNFPWVTRARTGVHNVNNMLKNHTADVSLYYVTRAYKTRHGAGPMPNEIHADFFPKIVDTTNVPNDWQGTLRIGLLDINELHTTITNDLKSLCCSGVNTNLVVTCIDQLNEVAVYIKDGKEKHVHGGNGLYKQNLQDLKDLFNWPILTTCSAITPETIAVL